jgi:hypothetical protein
MGKNCRGGDRRVLFIGLGVTVGEVQCLEHKSQLNRRFPYEFIVDLIGLVSCFDSFGLCGFHAKERVRTLRAESEADTSAHRQGWGQGRGRGWPGERDQARRRAGGCLGSALPRAARMGTAGWAALFGWAASSQLGRVGVGASCWVGLGLRPGFGPQSVLLFKIPFLFPTLFIICKLIRIQFKFGFRRLLLAK